MQLRFKMFVYEGILSVHLQKQPPKTKSKTRWKSQMRESLCTSEKFVFVVMYTFLLTIIFNIRKNCHA